MGLLKLFSILLILIFPMAEIGRIQFSNGVAVSLNDIFLAGLIISFAIYLFRKKKLANFKGSFLSKPLLLFSVIALISLILNIFNLTIDHFLISFLYLIRFVSYAFLYFIFKEFDTKFKIKVNYAMLFSGSMVVLLGFVQYLFYPSLRNLYYLGWDEHLYRLFSSFLDPNFAGAFYAIFFVYTVNFMRSYLKKKEQLKILGMGIISVLTLIALYLTYSRSALIMLIVSVVVYLYLINKKKFIALILLGVFLSIFILPKSFQTEGTNFLRATSSEARVANAKQAIQVIGKSPIYGIGFNAYRYAQNSLSPLSGPDWQVSHGGAGTDNSFLFILATTGVIGFAAFIFILYKLTRLGFTNIKKNKMAVVLVSVLLGLVVNSLFINTFFYVLILEWIWIIAAFTESSKLS